MTIHRYELTDSEWPFIEPMLPHHKMGRPQKDVRGHLTESCGLRAADTLGGPLRTLRPPSDRKYSCFRRWRDDGTLEQIFERLHEGMLLEEVSIGATAVKADPQTG